MIVEEVEARKHVILSPLSNRVTLRSKERAWLEVATAVNSLSQRERPVDKIKNKWQDLKLRTRKREAERVRQLGKTGNTKITICLSDLEEKVLSIIGKTSATDIEYYIDTAVVEDDMADRNDEEDIMNQMEEEDQGQEEEQDRTNAAHLMLLLYSYNSYNTCSVTFTKKKNSQK